MRVVSIPLKTNHVMNFIKASWADTQCKLQTSTSISLGYRLRFHLLDKKSTIQHQSRNKSNPENIQHPVALDSMTISSCGAPWNKKMPYSPPIKENECFQSNWMWWVSVSKHKPLVGFVVNRPEISTNRVLRAYFHWTQKHSWPGRCPSSHTKKIAHQMCKTVLRATAKAVSNHAHCLTGKFDRK